MHLPLIKYLSCIIILITTSITYAGSKINKCSDNFDFEPPSYINTLKRNLKAKIKSSTLDRYNTQVFERVAYNIINNRQLAYTINKKKLNGRKAWADIEDTILSILVEKNINTQITSAVITNKLNKKLIIDTALKKQTLSHNKQLYTEFVESYFNDPLFREWIYKHTTLNKIQDILKTPITKLNKLNRSLMNEAIQSRWLKFFETKNAEIPEWRTRILETIEEVYESHDF